MSLFKTEEAYKKHFKEALGDVSDELRCYLEEQFSQLDQLIHALTKENFWVLFPKILGVDAKLSLLTELIQFDDFCPTDILRIVETDYRTYYKELCGYELSMDPAHSMIFNVS